jgi:hypothetical protein
MPNPDGTVGSWRRFGQPEELPAKETTLAPNRFGNLPVWRPRSTGCLAEPGLGHGHG